MKAMFVAACACLVAAQATSAFQDKEAKKDKEAKTVRVIVFSPAVPTENDGKIGKIIANGTFTAIEVEEAKSTAVKPSYTITEKEKPMQEPYHRQRIAVSDKKDKSIYGNVFFATPMTKGFKLTNFVKRGTFEGKMGTTVSHHYVIYEATVVRP